MAKRSTLDTTDVWAAKLAALFAQQIGLPAGNIWEPAITRQLARRAQETDDQDGAELEYRFQLGLT